MQVRRLLLHISVPTSSLTMAYHIFQVSKSDHDNDIVMGDGHGSEHGGNDEDGCGAQGKFTNVVSLCTLDSGRGGGRNSDTIQETTVMAVIRIVSVLDMMDMITLGLLVFFLLMLRVLGLIIFPLELANIGCQ